MRKAFIVTGLGAGDEAKGATVDSLTRQFNAKLVVRFNGGAQAAHNVIADKKHHCFSQFGSGTLAGANTYLSEFMLIEPKAILNEADGLNQLGISNPLEHLFVDENTVIITPYHVILNRIKELSRGDFRHGSCGRGIGETAQDKANGITLKVKDLFNEALFREKLSWFRINKRPNNIGLSSEPIAELMDKFFNDEIFENIVKNYSLFIKKVKVVDRHFLNKELQRNECVVFEGAQGVLLDEKFGFAPYNTWSNTTNGNALDLLKDYDGNIIRLGLTRSYFTRHGAGPFVTEDVELKELLLGEHNKFNEWQQYFRAGHLDLVALKYAMEHCPVDYLVINHCDRILNNNKICIGYENISNPYYLNNSLQYISAEEQQNSLTKALFEAKPSYAQNLITKGNFINYVSEFLQIKTGILSYGPTHWNKNYFLDIK